jgi:predicted O-methyltransferase YrrM
VTGTTTGLDPRIGSWIRDHSLREPPVLARLRELTAGLLDASMQIAPEQGQLMALLVRLIGARRILEIGCFTGYSALWMAAAMPEGGRLITLDVNREWVEIGRRFWREAGVEARIEVRLGLAIESLDALLAEGAAESFDLVFIDADKKSYELYYERALELTRPGGLILLDNMLWGGSVADPANDDHQTRVLRALTDRLREDQRVEVSLLPIADGLALARKR